MYTMDVPDMHCCNGEGEKTDTDQYKLFIYCILDG